MLMSWIMMLNHIYIKASEFIKGLKRKKEEHLSTEILLVLEKEEGISISGLQNKLNGIDIFTLISKLKSLEREGYINSEMIYENNQLFIRGGSLKKRYLISRKGSLFIKTGLRAV
ncbi:hypothetical protein H6G33_10055 [Calothrix sp. FACHB-1219]|uniref:hypothetical protein n=1 Tax=unclassified Calothrix TaxID=2619626 RepID=UPI001688E20E|nr:MULTISPECIES: hypothetical protein [unclassified Calothrix]MBD2201690.1 hypothetical protein [Calothrix sp. FACHB-168]MBD2217376.1 hypothetical protein [Calothrix sp. FACHB-1219]